MIALSQAKGNEKFSAGIFDEAISFFSQAIELDPSNHVLYSNRSAAHSSLRDYDAALDDANKCISLRPDWGKGYSRLGAAYFGLEQWQSAIEAYETGLKHDPSSELLKNSLSDAKAAAAKPPASKSPFARPEFLAKLAMDPRTRGYLGQPDFMAMLQAVQTNPGSMNMFLGDPRFQLMMEIAFGFKMSAPAANDFGPAGKDDEDTPMTDTSSSAPAEKEKSPPSEADEEMAQDRERRRQKVEAQSKAVKEKEAGNEGEKSIALFPIAC